MELDRLSFSRRTLCIDGELRVRPMSLDCFTALLYLEVAFAIIPRLPWLQKHRPKWLTMVMWRSTPQQSSPCTISSSRENAWKLPVCSPALNLNCVDGNSNILKALSLIAPTRNRLPACRDCADRSWIT